MRDLDNIIKAITEDMVAIMKAVMDSDVGINNKVNKNTLEDSDLKKSLEASFDISGGNVVMELYANHYFWYIEHGREPQKGKQPPIDAIIAWMKKKRIPSTNGNIRSAAFLISRAIWRDGYDPRHMLEPFERKLDEKWERQYAEELFDYLTEELNKFFN